MALLGKRRPKRQKGAWRKRATKVANGGRRAKRWSKAPFRALNGRFGYRFCPTCGGRHPTVEWDNWQKVHAQEGRKDPRKDPNWKPPSQQGSATGTPLPRKKSKTVGNEQKRRGQGQPQNTRQPQGQTTQQKRRRRWGQAIDDRRKKMAQNGGGGPAGGGGADQAARYISAAAKALIDVEIHHHGEMKALAFGMNAALGELAQAVEQFHEARVRQRFHPRVLTPLNTVAAALVDTRAGWIQMINLIERHYAAWFDAVRNGGPVPGQGTAQGTYFDESQAG